MTAKNRKATDILLELVHKTDSVLGYLKDMNNKLNLILDKVNDVKKEATTEPSAQSPKRNDRRLVSQKILYPDGSIIKLAKVEVLDERKQVVSKTFTDHDGKWNINLLPGMYSVHIVKGPIEGKGLVNRKYDIVVNGDSNERLDLKDEQV